MNKIIQKSHRKKTPYYALNIILISLILLICIVYIGGVVVNTKEKLTETPYYSATVSKSKVDLLKKNNSTPLSEVDESVKSKDGYYVRIKDSCSVSFSDGNCVRARACPSLNCPTVTSLRDGMVLKTTGETTFSDGITWYKIIFDEWVRYPERLASEWYISELYLDIVYNKKESFKEGSKVQNFTNKRIEISRKEQKLYAYEGDKLFMETVISTGLDYLPTPKGTFNIYSKTPSRYMQGPLPGVSSDPYDLPGVPWTMYFTYDGAAIHGTYWHNSFGTPWSHGCVNVNLEDSEALYNWAGLGTTVIVVD